MHKQSGFTVIELIIAISILALAGVLFMQQKSDIERVDRDRQRKTAINAIHYSLQEIFYPANNYYPRVLNRETLKAVDPALFKDPNGKALGENGSSYRYDPTNCDGDKCTAYTLSSNLEAEADFVRKSR